MADPNRRQTILAAARTVFAERGYRRASIKRIAEAADLKSPALIYWYFDNKEALLSAVLTEGIPLARLDEIAEWLFEQPPEQVLPMVLQGHLTGIEDPELQSLARIVVGEGIHNPELAAELASRIDPIFSLIKGYIDHQVANGRFRPHDTNVSVRSLMSISVFYALNQLLLPGLGAPLPEKSTYLTEAIGIFLRGLAPEKE